MNYTIPFTTEVFKLKIQTVSFLKQTEPFQLGFIRQQYANFVFLRFLSFFLSQIVSHS